MRTKGQIGAKYLQNTRKRLVEPDIVVVSHHKTESVLKKVLKGAVKRIK